jgi:homoserine O-succinyltransferase
MQMHSEKKHIRIAILDLYEGQPNQGMRCIREILDQYAAQHQHLDLSYDTFEVRIEEHLPDLSYDIFISSGGPGSPLESENSDWEKKYFNWLSKVENWNEDSAHAEKKSVFFICHSFQLACRHYEIAKVTRRKSTAFGVFPIHFLKDGFTEPVFEGLNDPFYSVDSRDFQVIQADQDKLNAMGGSLLAIEKERPHVPLERAIMAVRFNEYMVGTQFHPEADARGMTVYLLRDDKKKTVIAEHGEEKWRSMIEQLNDPDKILLTYSHVLPNFIDHSIELLQEAII